jgi:pyridoxal phosphate enzyme (YggS family)
MLIAENLKKIHEEICFSCQKASRQSSEVTLIAVSKTKPASQILEAISAKQIDFGENYVQEAVQKIAQISNPLVQWHFIGHLQSNKVSQVVGPFSLIHSVDRISLAEAISKVAGQKKMIQNILMEINLGDEESKSGVHLKDAPELLSKILRLENLSVHGLMALPPLRENEEEQRQYFRILKRFMSEYSAQLSDSQKSKFKILSMGTSSDFKAAILEGATHVRIGTAIFGAREIEARETGAR